MKKILFLIFSALAFIFAGCSNNEEPVSSTDIQSTQATLTKSIGFTAAQEATLLRLLEINDSISTIAKESNNTSNGQQKLIGKLNFGKIISADVEGFKMGWNEGKKKCKFFLFKIITATASAIASSAEASDKEMQNQLSLNQENRPSSSSYSVTDYLTTLALIWDSDNFNAKILDYRQFYPELVQNATNDEIKAALAHNAILETINPGLVYPSGILTDFYSEEQLQYFNSISYKRYFKNIPKYIAGTLSFEDYLGASPFPYETEIVNQYTNGILQAYQANPSAIASNVRNLCIEYSRVINTDTNIDAEAKEIVMSNIQVGPMSCIYWQDKLNN